MASLQRALISDIRNTNAWNERIDGIGSFLFVKERLALALFTKSVDDGEQVAERKDSEHKALLEALVHHAIDA